MPIFLIYQCANCGAEAPQVAMGNPPPSDWVNLVVNGRPEWFDKWDCVQAYANKQKEKDAGT